MPIALIIGGALALFFYALSQSVTAGAEADVTPADIAQDFDPSGRDVIYMSTPDRQALLRALGTGIAQGEGYFKTGTVPNRNNNPGDIKVGGVIATLAPDTPDAPAPGGGWALLYHQLNLNLNGSSAIYDLTMSLREMCSVWTALPDNGRGNSAELDGYVDNVIASLNNSNFPATENTTLGALARGDFSA